MEQPVSENLVLWQYRKVMGELLLTQAHSSDKSCPCELSSEAEYCLPKHLIALQAYAEETMAMVEDEKAKGMLLALAEGANDLRREYEEAEKAERPYDKITEFARQSRKELEPFLFKYKQSGTKLFQRSSIEELKQVTAQIGGLEQNLRRQHSYWVGNADGKPQFIQRYGKDARKEMGTLIEPFKASQNLCFSGEGSGRMELCGGGTKMKQDPLLTRIAEEICTEGVCFAGEPNEQLPLCTKNQAQALERCILEVKVKQPDRCFVEPKAKLEERYYKPDIWIKDEKGKIISSTEEGCYSAHAVCRASLGCRLGAYVNGAREAEV